MNSKADASEEATRRRIDSLTSYTPDLFFTTKRTQAYRSQFQEPYDHYLSTLLDRLASLPQSSRRKRANREKYRNAPRGSDWTVWVSSDLQQRFLDAKADLACNFTHGEFVKFLLELDDVSKEGEGGDGSGDGSEEEEESDEDCDVGTEEAVGRKDSEVQKRVKVRVKTHATTVVRRADTSDDDADNEKEVSPTASEDIDEKNTSPASVEDIFIEPESATDESLKSRNCEHPDDDDNDNETDTDGTIDRIFKRAESTDYDPFHNTSDSEPSFTDTSSNLTFPFLSDTEDDDNIPFPYPFNHAYLPMDDTPLPEFMDQDLAIERDLSETLGNYLESLIPAESSCAEPCCDVTGMSDVDGWDEGGTVVFPANEAETFIFRAGHADPILLDTPTFSIDDLPDLTPIPPSPPLDPVLVTLRYDCKTPKEKETYAL
ncbi:hypothetical protein HK104_003638, partial [Borealophlyctis nickersoniae]